MKSFSAFFAGSYGRSLPVRGAWVEMLEGGGKKWWDALVAPRAGSVG